MESNATRKTWRTRCYLTGNPQITFFKVVYRRHTNFAIESIEQTFNGNCEFGKRVSATISRNGDLIHNCILEVTVPKLVPEPGEAGPIHLVRSDGETTTVAEVQAATRLDPATCNGEWEERSALVRGCVEEAVPRWVEKVGHWMIKGFVEVEIGGQRIDKHYLVTGSRYGMSYQETVAKILTTIK